MKIKNQIINYFVSQSHGKTLSKAYRAPVTMDADTARKVLNQALRKKNKNIRLKMLHVCFDNDSAIVYLPNAKDFHVEQRKYMLNVALARISKDFGGFSEREPIEGSPFSSLRIRPLRSFTYAHNTICNNSQEREIKDITIIEANLAKMPTTLKSLPNIYQEHNNFIGSYISTPITFIDEVDNYGKRKQKEVILEQKDPFILINISKIAKPSTTEKEWVVLSGYRDFLFAAHSDLIICDEVNASADLFAIKRYLYLGWSFEELSSFFLDSISNFLEFIKAVVLLMKSANALEQEGYKNPATDHYYVTAKIDPKTFALKLDSIFNASGSVDPFQQVPYFEIIDYDQNTNYIVIKTPVFLSEYICQQILRIHNPPLIVRYNNVLNMIDVKSPRSTYTSLNEHKEQLKKIETLIKYDINDEEKSKTVEFRLGEGAQGVNLANPQVFNTRKISDYLYASDFISRMCKERNINFRDLDVIVGPIAQLFGQGTQGGFIDEKQFKEKKLTIPHKITHGFYITPPLMMINTESMTSYAEQTSTIIHEYSHYLFSQSNPDHKQEYDPNKVGKGYGTDHFVQWDRYFSDEDEVKAHTTQIKYELLSGQSVDEIIRDKVGGQITEDNYIVAIRFKELVQDAIDELEKEKDNEMVNR